MLNIFLLSFLVALTGALSPGPVLTFTIYKSLQKRGYLAGVFIILGHATLEFGLIILLLLGAYIFLQNLIVLILIGILGGIFLVVFGLLVIRDAMKSDLTLNFESIDEQDIKGYKGNSFFGGIIISLSNPFWSFWWAVIGLSLMLNLGISFDNPLGLLLFFLGHELGDFVFYVPVSIFVYLGGKALNAKIYKYILITCGLFMMVFGIYLALNIIFFPPAL